MVDYQRRSQLAEVYGKVPAGSRLTVKIASDSELLIALVNDVAGGAPHEPVGLLPVPVPERLGKPHRVASEFREAVSLHEISRKTLPRAARIVHAIAVETERRGYAIACAQVRVDSHGRSDWKATADGQVVITINGHSLRLRIWEKGAGLRGPYESSLRRWREDRERPISSMLFLDRPKPYDRDATGELNIAVLGFSSGRQSTWGDRQRWKLEDRLSNVLRELELEAAEAEERRLARERELAERQRQWEVAMERAKERYLEDHRVEVLRTRVRAWQEADEISAYCDAVESRHGADVVDSTPGAAEWLSFAREVASLLQKLPTMPADPDVTPDKLKPYLGKWSPYGPQGW
ncbi:MAG TPA: hypothetical protein VKT78_19485 [Fimbriimonadaceae bacterium]|nr:hypothetical protein [Fimbriimonadaceae bacterium]